MTAHEQGVGDRQEMEPGSFDWWQSLVRECNRDGDRRQAQFFSRRAWDVRNGLVTSSQSLREAGMD